MDFLKLTDFSAINMGTTSILKDIVIYTKDIFNCKNYDKMMTWLDPDYIVVEWLNIQQPPLPDLSAVDPPISLNAAINNTIQHSCYSVQSRTDGEFLLGRLIERWPGTIGFVTSSPTSLVFRT
jgi:hypothetical protein